MKTGEYQVKPSDFRDSAPMTAAFATVGAGWGSFAAQVPVLKAQIGASDSQFGLAMLIASVGAVSAMWCAPLIDRWLKTRVLMVLSFGIGFAFLLPGLTGTVAMFAAAMVIAAMFSGTLDVLVNARVSAQEARTGRSMMVFQHGMYALAYAISAFLTGLARAAGASPVQIFAGVLVGVAAMTFLAGLPKSVNRAGSAGKAETPGGVAPWIVLLAGGIILIAFMTEQSIESWSALHLERSLGAGAVGGALGPALLGATMAIGRFGGQVVVNRWGAIRVTYWAAIVTSAGAFLAAFAPSIAVAYTGFVILGFGVSVIVPMGLVIVGRVVSDEARTRTIARVSAFGYGGFFAGPPILGFLSEWNGLDVAFAFIACILLLILPLTFLLSKRAG